MPRLYCPVPLQRGAALSLPEGAARHVQVLRLQPGAPLVLFNGEGGEWDARVTRMGRSEVAVEITDHRPVEREAQRPVHLVVAMPANERMDWLVEKAAELGVASVQPVLAARCVLRPSGERADKKRAHWQAIAVAACEQCGRNRVPTVHPVLALADWLATPDTPDDTGTPQRLVLSLQDTARPLGAVVDAGADHAVTLLSGPEGGLTAEEEHAARAAGFVAVSLGARVLRAETAPLAVLAALTLAR